MSITTRSYRPDDEVQILELLHNVYKKWPMFDLTHDPMEHWTWKFLDNPIKQTCVTISEIDGKVVGTAHAILKYIKVGDKIFLTGIGSDAAVDPKCRGQGVYSRTHEYNIQELKDRGIWCWSGITSNPVMIKMMSGRGEPFFPHKLVELIRIKNLTKHMKMSRSWVRVLDDVKENLIDRISHVRRKSESINVVKKESHYNVENIDIFDDRVNIFWNKIKENYDFIYVRNKEYLNWRYCDGRGGAYITRVIYEQDEILGFIILRLDRSNINYTEGYIVDLLTLPGKKDVAQALIHDSIQYFDEMDVNVIRFWGLDMSLYVDLLYSFGFVEVPFKLHLVFNNKLISEKEISIIENSKKERIHFSYGDHDMI